MKKFYELATFYGLPCRPKTFEIKDKKALLEDFGKYVDGDKKECDNKEIVNWGCYKRFFEVIPYEDNKKIAEKYGLTEKEYNELVEDLKKTFAIGTCDWCV